MHRLKRSAQVYSIAVGGQGDAGRDPDNRARVREDPMTMMHLAAPMMGPHRIMDDAYSEETLTRLLGSRAGVGSSV